MPQQHHAIDYVELPARDLAATKAFFSDVFGWSFQNYGPDYTAILDAGLDGGFFRAAQHADTRTGSGLVILYSTDLEATRDSIEAAGGEVVKPIFAFPGGRRFHFTEPSGNEFAVWSAEGVEDASA